MVYSLIPNAGQSLGQTRDGIKENFTTLQTAFNVDHVDLDASGQGFHAKVNFPEGSAPSVATGSVVMYAKDTNSRPTIWMRQENNGTEIQLSGPDPTVSTNGKTFLPGGLLLQWGAASIVPNGSNTITFPTAFSSGPYSVVATGDYLGSPSSALMVCLGTVTASNFIPVGIINGNTLESATTRTIRWHAIGPI